MTPSCVAKNSTGRVQAFRLFFAIAAAFFLGAVPVSADVFRSLPEGGDSLNRLTLSSENGFYPNQASAPLTSKETASTGYSDAAYDESVSSVFNSRNTAFASILANSDTSISLENHQNVTVSGAPGETVTLDLQNFIMTGHSTFTLEGTATTMFVINVTKQFSLSGSARVVLSGGVRWDHVFFNVLGRGSVVSLNGIAKPYGTLTASQRTVKMFGHSIVYGAVVANRVILRGAAQIIPPPIVSP